MRNECCAAHRAVILDASIPCPTVQEFTGGCTWGSNCGGSCTSDTYDPNDPLDTACYMHDKCLDDSAYDQYNSAWSCAFSGEVNCNCDTELARAAWEVGAQRGACTCAWEGGCLSEWCRSAFLPSHSVWILAIPTPPQVYNANWKDCPWWNFFCWEEKIAIAARAVAASQDYRQYCGSCSNGLPPDYVAPSEPVYEERYTDTTPSDSSGSDLLDTLGSCTYDIYADTNLQGGDIEEGKSVTDAGECCQKCDDRSDCYAW